MGCDTQRYHERMPSSSQSTIPDSTPVGASNHGQQPGLWSSVEETAVDSENGAAQQFRAGSDDGNLIVGVGQGGHTGTLNKAVDALAIVPTRQRIYPLARKLYNVLLYLAQKQGLDRDTYRAPLFDIVSKAKFNSKDLKIVKNHLRAMNSTQVEWQSPTAGEGARWDISNLIAHAAIEEPGSGKPVIVEWSFAPNIKRELLNPARFAQISLVFQSTLRTHASIALFEICSRYADNPTRLTSRRPWAWWRPVLTGVPETQVGAYTKYKYFKRDVLRPAITEINRITNLDVALVEHKEGRQIQDLQFEVVRKQRAEKVSPAKLDLGLVARVVNLGVSQRTAEKLLAEHGSAAMTQAMEVLRERINANTGKPIENADRYIGGVLRRLAPETDEATVAAQPATPVEDNRPKRADLEIAFRDKLRRKARAVFDNLNKEEQGGIVARFESEFIAKAPQIIKRSYKKVGLEQPAIRAEFGQWYAKSLWGDGCMQPTTEDLLALATQ